MDTMNGFRVFFLGCFLAGLLSDAQSQDTGDTALTVTPAFKWVSEAQPYGSISLINSGTRTVEVILDVGYGVIEASPEGIGNIIRMDTAQVAGNLTQHLTLFPPRMVIPPGETQTLRYLVNQINELPDGGYSAMIICNISPRAPVDPDQVPISASAMQIDFSLSVPLIMNKGVGIPRMSADVLAVDSTAIKLFLTNPTPIPWGGTVRLMSLDEEMEYGSAGVSVLFANREVIIPLDSPIEDAARIVFDGEVSWMPPSARARHSAPASVLIEI